MAPSLTLAHEASDHCALVADIFCAIVICSHSLFFYTICREGK